MEDRKQNLIDAQNLKKYPEYYALKQEMEFFCDKMDSISDIDLSAVSRVSLEQEIYGRRWASQQVRELLSTLGLVDKTKPKMIDRTGE